MKTNKLVKLLLLGLIFTTILAGCGEKAARNTADASADITKSKKIKLDEEYEEVHDIQKMKSGAFRVGVSDAKGLNSRIFESTDQGKTWKKIETLNNKVSATDQDFLQFYLGSNEEIFVKVIKGAASYEETFSKKSQYFVINQEKKMVELPVTLEEISETEKEHQKHSHESDHIEINSLSQVAFIGDGQLLAVDFGRTGYLIDAETGKTQQKYKFIDNFEYADSLFADQDYVYFSSTIGFLTYDKKNGKLVTDTQLEKAVSEKLEEAYNQHRMIGTSIYTGDKEEQIYFTNGLGIFNYDTRSEQTEKKVDLTQTDLGLTQDYGRFVTYIDSNNYLISVTNTSNQKQSVYLSTKYSGEAAAKQKEEITTLTIWTLRESTELKQIIDSFKSQIPNVEVKIQVGMDDTSAQTVSDAISTLNTKMLANEGPDIILADGLPIETYAEKGMLTDLQVIYDKLSNKDQLFENVATAFQSKNGLFAIPQGFAYMAVTAKKGTTEQVKTIKGLSEYIDTHDSGVSVDNAKMLTSLLYYASIQEWFDGKTINQEKLKVFFEQHKTLREKIELYEPQKIDFNQDAYSFYSGNFYEFIEEFPDAKSIDVALDYIGLSHLEFALQDLLKQEYETSLFNETDNKLFLPVGVLSISKSSKNQEMAQKFVEFTLSKNGTNIVGIPTNKNQFEKAFQLNLSDDRNESKLTEADYQKITKFLGELKEPVYMNSVLSETIVKQLEEYEFNGESLDTAVNNAAKKIDLYMAE